MGTRVRRTAVAAIGAASGLAILAWLGLVGFACTDYAYEVAPAFKARADDGSVGVPCLLAAGALGGWLVARMRTLGLGTLARATALGLCVASPIMLRALEIGHPDELLGAVLCVAAVLTALSGRANWS